MTQGNVQKGGRVLEVLQDRALIKQNLRPTVGGKKQMATVGELKKIRFGGNRQGKGFIR